MAFAFGGEKVSKSVLMSIQPEYCQLIADGYKIAEVRKNFPKLETPFKVYIYCTNGKGYSTDIKGYSPDIEKGKVIGEFLCEFIEKFPYDTNRYFIEAADQLCAEACLDENDLYRYLHGATPYAWYISDLVIYETPKELSEFGKTRPPQSWYYVDKE